MNIEVSHLFTSHRQNDAALKNDPNAWNTVVELMLGCYVWPAFCYADVCKHGEQQAQLNRYV
jgi:hypothetical protein